MYVLLNLKDEAKLQNVVQLLFSHGHRQLSIGESIESLCPKCERESSAPSSDPPPPAPEFSCSTPVNDDYSTNLKKQYNSMSPITSASSPGCKYEDVSVKEEPSDEGNDDVDMSGDIDEEMETMNLSQALELIGGHSKPGTKGSKRIKSDEPFGELFQCQLCKKFISRHGQYANLLNHLSRHARLHASKKQYCCPKCGATYTRRYLASAHIKEVHNDMVTEPHDYAYELKEEYKSLLDICFPGADHRKKAHSPGDSDKNLKDKIINIIKSTDDSGISMTESELGVSNEKNVIEVRVGTAISPPTPSSDSVPPKKKKARLNSSC